MHVSNSSSFSLIEYQQFLQLMKTLEIKIYLCTTNNRISLIRIKTDSLNRLIDPLKKTYSNRKPWSNALLHEIWPRESLR